MNDTEDAVHDLLELWLSSLEKERKLQFADTAAAAQMVGRSQRTIQFWIDAGWIRAVPVGKKHQVYVKSLKDYLRRRVDIWEAKATALKKEYS